jgi:hypothetical protein
LINGSKRGLVEEMGIGSRIEGIVVYKKLEESLEEVKKV